jgi:hypothetical protein
MTNFSTLLLALAIPGRLCLASSIQSRAVDQPFKLDVYSPCEDHCDKPDMDRLVVTQLAPNTTKYSGTSMGNFLGKVSPYNSSEALVAEIPFNSTSDEPKQVWFDNQSAGIHMAVRLSTLSTAVGSY